MRNTKPRGGSDHYIMWILDSNLCGLSHLRRSILNPVTEYPDADEKV